MKKWIALAVAPLLGMSMSATAQEYFYDDYGTGYYENQGLYEDEGFFDNETMYDADAYYGDTGYNQPTPGVYTYRDAVTYDRDPEYDSAWREYRQELAQAQYEYQAGEIDYDEYQEEVREARELLTQDDGWGIDYGNAYDYDDYGYYDTNYGWYTDDTDYDTWYGDSDWDWGW